MALVVLNNICLKLYFFPKWFFCCWFWKGIGVWSGSQMVSKIFYLPLSTIFKVLELFPQTPRKKNISWEVNETYCNSNYIWAPWGVLWDPGNVVVRGELWDIVVGIQQANHYVSRRAEFLWCVHLYCKKLRREKQKITTKQLLVFLKELPPPPMAHWWILAWLDQAAQNQGDDEPGQRAASACLCVCACDGQSSCGKRPSDLCIHIRLHVTHVTSHN